MGYILDDIQLSAQMQVSSNAESGKVNVVVLPVNYGSQPQLNANMPSYVGGDDKPMFQRMAAAFEKFPGAGAPVYMEEGADGQSARGLMNAGFSLFGDNYEGNARAGLSGMNLIIVLAIVAGGAYFFSKVR